MKKNDGSIVLEASLTIPFFALLLLAAVSLLQIGAAELAMRSAVSETVKTVAANMYPVSLAYAEAKQKAESSKAADIWNGISGRVLAARSQLQNAESFVEDYAAYLPEPVVKLVEGEQMLREQLEESAGDKMGEAKMKAIRALAKTVFTPMLRQYVNSPVLTKERLQVTSVELPVPDDPDKAWFGMEAEYDMKLALPMFSKTIKLKKTALERCWIGS